jgi:hypothetical protein
LNRPDHNRDNLAAVPANSAANSAAVPAYANVPLRQDSDEGSGSTAQLNRPDPNRDNLVAVPANSAANSAVVSDYANVPLRQDSDEGSGSTAQLNRPDHNREEKDAENIKGYLNDICQDPIGRTVYRDRLHEAKTRPTKKKAAFNDQSGEKSSEKRKKAATKTAATDSTPLKKAGCQSTEHALECLIGEENKEYWAEGELLSGLACAECKLKFAIRPKEIKEEINPKKVYFCKEIRPSNGGACLYSLCGNCYNGMLLANGSSGKRKRKRTQRCKD